VVLFLQFFKVTAFIMKNSFILLVLIVLIFLQNAIPKHETVNNIFKSDILKVIDEVSKLEGLIESNSSTVELQKQFLKAQQLQTSGND
jgi:cytochrome c peroxidase